MRLSLQRGGPWPFPSGIPIPKTSLLARVRFFVTSSIADKRKLLQSDRSAGLFIRTLYEYRAEGKFRLHEYVVMPDHFHVLLTVDAGMSVERAVQFIKGGFAFRAGKELGMRSPVWQKGFSDARVLARLSRGCVSTFTTTRSSEDWSERPASFAILQRMMDLNSMTYRRG